MLCSQMQQQFSAQQLVREGHGYETLLHGEEGCGPS